MRMILIFIVLGGLWVAGGPAWGQSINARVSLVSAPVVVRTGEPFEIAATVDLAPLSADPLTWRAFLSADGTMASSMALGPLAPVLVTSAGERVRATVVAPDAPGQYFLIVEIDAEERLAESNELDNVAVSANRIRIQRSQADLRAVGVIAPARLTAGDAVSVDVEVDNVGDASASAELRVYLTADDVVSDVDVEVARTTVVLPAGSMRRSTLIAQVSTALPAGSYRWGAIIDPVAEESVPDNNLVVGPAVIVRQSFLRFIDRPLPAPTLSIPYFARLAATGGDGRIRYAVTDGVLPSGLSLTADGVLHGVPTQTGDFTFTVNATSDGRTAVLVAALRVVGTGQPLAIVYSEAGRAFRGLPYDQSLVAGGGEPPYAWRRVPDAGPLPAGLSLSTDGRLTGVPETFGRSVFDVEVTDSLSAVDRATVTVEVTSPSGLLIGQDPLSPVVVGQPVDISLPVVGGTPPYVWTALTPPPPGLQVTDDGRIEGTPTAVGTWPVRVRVADSRRQPSVDDAVIRVVVQPDGQFEIVTRRLPSGQVRTNYEAFLEASGGRPPFLWRIVPGTSLPDGFFLEPAEAPANAARIFGRGLLPVDQAFAVRVEDASGQRREVALVLSLNELPAGEAGEAGCTCVRPRGDSGAWRALLEFLNRLTERLGG